MGRKIINHSGEKIGSWYLVERVENEVHKYLCMCTKCFGVWVVHISNLLSGRTSQCKECRIEERKN